MATDKEFLTFVLDQLNDPQITTRPMMGEYVLYYAGKPVGGLYDDRLLVKITPSTEPLAQTGEPLPRAVPYPGAKELWSAPVDDPERTLRLIRAAADDLPAPKPRKKT